MLDDLGMEVRMAESFMEEDIIFLQIPKDTKDETTVIVNGHSQANIFGESHGGSCKVISLVPWTGQKTALLPFVSGTLSWPISLNRLERTIIDALGLKSVTRTQSSYPAVEDVDKNSRILVAEDNLANQKVIQGLLARFGFHQCDIVANGQEVLEAMNRGPYDIILMDCTMPVMDGYIATQKIRQLEKEKHRPHIPVVALTASAMEEDKENCFAAGMDDFMTKPVRPKQLLEMLAKYLPNKVRESQ
jgi:CheY-like chemotaxis protein